MRSARSAFWASRLRAHCNLASSQSHSSYPQPLKLRARPQDRHTRVGSWEDITCPKPLIELMRRTSVAISLSLSACRMRGPRLAYLDLSLWGPQPQPQTPTVELNEPPCRFAYLLAPDMVIGPLVCCPLSSHQWRYPVVYPAQIFPLKLYAVMSIFHSSLIAIAIATSFPASSSCHACGF